MDCRKPILPDSLGLHNTDLHKKIIYIGHTPSYYVQLCQPKCQIYEKTEYFEYATTVLKPNLFYLINLFGINNVILQGKVEDKISNEARQRHITEKLRNFGTWNCGTLQHVFFV